MKTAGKLFLAGLFAIAVPILAQQVGAWFPALAFLGWAGLLAVAGGALMLASMSLEDRQ